MSAKLGEFGLSGRTPMNCAGVLYSAGTPSIFKVRVGSIVASAEASALRRRWRLLRLPRWCLGCAARPLISAGLPCACALSLKTLRCRCPSEFRGAPSRARRDPRMNSSVGCLPSSVVSAAPHCGLPALPAQDQPELPRYQGDDAQDVAQHRYQTPLGATGQGRVRPGARLGLSTGRATHTNKCQPVAVPVA